MKLGEVVCSTHGYYNFTKFHQNRMKNKSVFIIDHKGFTNFLQKRCRTEKKCYGSQNFTRMRLHWSNTTKDPPPPLHHPSICVPCFYNARLITKASGFAVYFMRLTSTLSTDPLYPFFISFSELGTNWPSRFRRRSAASKNLAFTKCGYIYLLYRYILDILFSSNHKIHKTLCGHCFWASDPLIDRF